MSLGRELSVYRGTLGAGGLWWLYVGLGLMAAAAGVAQGEVAVAAATLALTGLLALMPLSRWRQTLTIHEHGLAWRGLLRARVVPRAQVLGAKAEWRHGEMSSSSELVITLPLGQRLRLRGLADAEAAAAELARFVALPGP
jgi:hypothetical protein